MFLKIVDRSQDGKIDEIIAISVDEPYEEIIKWMPAVTFAIFRVILDVNWSAIQEFLLTKDNVKKKIERKPK